MLFKYTENELTEYIKIECYRKFCTMFVFENGILDFTFLYRYETIKEFINTVPVENGYYAVFRWIQEHERVQS